MLKDLATVLRISATTVLVVYSIAATGMIVYMIEKEEKKEEE